MKAVLFLVFFSFVAFAEDADNKISVEREAFLQDALVEAYGQEAADEVNMQKEAKSQVLALLPDILLSCAFGEGDLAEANLPSSFRSENCKDVIIAAKNMGISRDQVGIVIAQLAENEEVYSERMGVLQSALSDSSYVYLETEMSDAEKEIMAQLPEQLSNCRENDEGVDAYIPNVFQESLCSEVIADVMEAGISYAMVSDTLNNLTVVAEVKKKKPRTVAKP